MGIAVVTVNDTDKSMWVSIYAAPFGGIGKRDWGCVEPHSTREWRSANYQLGEEIKVRGEIKAELDCGGDTIFDTNITDYVSGICRFVMKTDNGSYWWEYQCPDGTTVRADGDRPTFQQTDEFLGQIRTVAKQRLGQSQETDALVCQAFGGGMTIQMPVAGTLNVQWEPNDDTSACVATIVFASGGSQNIPSGYSSTQLLRVTLCFVIATMAVRLSRGTSASRQTYSIIGGCRRPSGQQRTPHPCRSASVS